MHEQTCVIPIFSLLSVDSTSKCSDINSNKQNNLAYLILFVCVDLLHPVNDFSAMSG